MASHCLEMIAPLSSSSPEFYSHVQLQDKFGPMDNPELWLGGGVTTPAGMAHCHLVYGPAAPQRAMGAQSAQAQPSRGAAGLGFPEPR